MADCLNKKPIRLKQPIESGDRWIYNINVPCGKCARCLQRRKMEWAFRMETEMEYAKTAYFVTLTYSPENVPYNKYGQKTLIPTRADDLRIRLAEEGRKRITKKWKKERTDRSLQGFFKRLRRNQETGQEYIEHLYNGLLNTDKIKFYACGEYGEENGRPHYHAIILNTSEKNILKSWEFGNVHVVKANKQTIAYVMKYLDKQLGNSKNWKGEPEFNIMSEGLGNEYILRNTKWHKKNLDILYVTNLTGFKIPMPKIFRLKMFNEEERTKQVVMVSTTLDELRDEFIYEHGEDIYNKYNNMQPKEDLRRFKKKSKKRIVD